MITGRLVARLGAGRFVENLDGVILGLGRRDLDPIGLRLGFDGWPEFADSSPKSGITSETPPMVIVTGWSTTVDGSAVVLTAAAGRGLGVLAVGGLRGFEAADARSFCCRLRGSNLKVFAISWPISK